MEGQLAPFPVGGLVLEPPFPPEVFENNRRLSRERKLLGVAGIATKRRLAIVGSGHSIRAKFQELCDFDGEIWAINGAWQWLADHGLETTFFSVDPTLSILAYVRKVKRAVLHAWVDPTVFDQILLNWGEIRLFDPEGSTGGFSAVGATFAGIEAGFKEISFFGCECSHADEQTHIFAHSTDPRPMILVDVLGEEFITRPNYHIQALELSNLIRELPGLIDRSGGLLGAMVNIPREPEAALVELSGIYRE